MGTLGVACVYIWGGCFISHVKLTTLGAEGVNLMILYILIPNKYF